MGYELIKSFNSVGPIAVALISKGGSNSIREASEGWYLTNEKAIDYPLRLLFIREPFKRFISAYSFFNRLYWDGTEYTCKETTKAAAKSYYDFVNFALNNNDDHWMPQSDSVLLNGELTPTHIIKFEKINTIWPNFTTKELKTINTTVSLPVCPEYRRSELNKMFGKDIELYNDALEVFDGR